MANESDSTEAPVKRDFRKEVTDQIIEMLEKAPRPGRSPGSQDRFNSPSIPLPKRTTGAAMPFI
jgi:hypothetical protein